MGKLIDFIAKETEGEPFGSFKYGYDNDPQLHFPYDGKPQPITQKQYIPRYFQRMIFEVCAIIRKLQMQITDELDFH